MKIKLLLASLLIAGTVLAQTTTNTPPAMNAPPSSGFLEDLAAGLASVTNWVVAPYGTYAPDAPTKYGGGIIGFYNINQYVGAGPGVDWLGDFNLVSANLTLRLPIHVSKITTTPFIIAGLATPISGAGKANGQVATIAGAGLAVDLFKIKKVKVGAGYAYDLWTNAGDFSGKHHQIFISGKMGF